MITMSKDTYVNGEAVTAIAALLENQGSLDAKVELALWLEYPGLEAISLLNLGADGSFILPQNFSQDLGPFTIFTVSASFPRNSYALNSRMVNPVTNKLLSEDLNPFLIR